MKASCSSGIAALIVLTLASPALSAGIAPPDYSFIIVGGGNLVKNGNDGWSCLWNFKMTSGPSVGGTPPRAAGGTMPGGTAGVDTCTQMTVAPSTYSITSSTATGGTGVFHGLTFRRNGVNFCSTTNNVPFQYLNNGDSPSDVFFDSAAIGTNCIFAAALKTAADLNVVP